MAITTDLDAYWDFNSFVRQEDVVDLVGSNNLTSADATNSWPDVASGLKEHGREFDSTEGTYLKCSDSADVSISSGESFTMVSWVLFHDSIPPTRYEEKRGIPPKEPLKAIIRKGAATQFDSEWQVEIKVTNSDLWDVSFQVQEAGAEFSDRAYSLIHHSGNYGKLFSQTWHMVVCRYNHSTLKTNVRFYQGISRQTGSMFPEGSPSRWDFGHFGSIFADSSNHSTVVGWVKDFTHPNFTAAYDGTAELRFGAPPFGSAATAKDKTDFTVDSTGIWSRYLTNEECDYLYNGGHGLEHPFNPPWGDIYTPKPTPIFLPTPHALYHGHGWNVGTIPENAPAPNGWHHTQPTLPAWRVPPRIAGWSYGNNYPLPAPEPLVSQWWFQASEPVKTDPRMEHLAPGPVEVAPKAGGEEPVIPAPPPPPAPPADNSEATVSDEEYRPGRADNDQSRYGTS